MKGKLSLKKETVKILVNQQNVLGGKDIGFYSCACWSQKQSCKCPLPLPPPPPSPLPMSCVCPGSPGTKIKL